MQEILPAATLSQQQPVHLWLAFGSAWDAALIASASGVLVHRLKPALRRNTLPLTQFLKPSPRRHLFG